MKNYIVPANGDALVRAAKALFGDEGVKSLQQAYVAIDEAQQFAYDAGYAAASAEAKVAEEDAASEHAAEMAFIYDEGVSEGKLVSEEALQDAFDDGYVEGVDDARHDPAEADTYIEYLLALDEAEAADEQQPYEGDSGDENDADLDIIRMRKGALN